MLLLDVWFEVMAVRKKKPTQKFGNLTKIKQRSFLKKINDR